MGDEWLACASSSAPHTCHVTKASRTCLCSACTTLRFAQECPLGLLFFLSRASRDQGPLKALKETTTKPTKQNKQKTVENLDEEQGEPNHQKQTNKKTVFTNPFLSTRVWHTNRRSVKVGWILFTELTQDLGQFAVRNDGRGGKETEGEARGAPQWAKEGQEIV